MLRFLPLLLVLGLVPLAGQDIRGPDLTKYEVLAEVLAKKSIPGLVVIDVRSPEEFSKGHIPGAVNYPLVVGADETSPLYSRFPSNSAKAPILVYGRPASSDARKAVDILRMRNYQNVIYFGSITQWKGELQ